MAKPAKKMKRSRVTPEQRLAALIDALGNNRVAELLGVSRSQPSRWRAGIEGMSPESLARLTDLDYVWERLTQVYLAEVALVWLRSYNHHLGARPEDVFRFRGAGPVIRAIDAEDQGAYA